MKTYHLPPFSWFIHIINICNAFLVTLSLDSKWSFGKCCQNLPFAAQNLLKLEVYSDEYRREMCSTMVWQIFFTFHLNKILFGASNRSKMFQIVLQILQILQVKNRGIAHIWLQKKTNLGNFIIILLRKFQYFKNYLEYFNSVWSTKEYLIQIKYKNICQAVRPHMYPTKCLSMLLI